MALNDPIADLLTRIRNAKEAKHRYVDVPKSSVLGRILQVMQDTGFVESFLPNEAHRKFRVFLKYTEGRRSLIQGLKRVSSPGLRRYVGYDKIPVLFRGLGVSIISTPKGIFDGETARKMKIGGELLCYVW